MFVFNDSDDEYTVFASTQEDAEKKILEYFDSETAAIICPPEANSIEDLGIHYSAEYEVIEGAVLLRSLR